MHLLISGIPASGKTTLCKWLEENKGFLHIEVEEPFVQALDKFKRPVAIDWGFPPWLRERSFQPRSVRRDGAKRQ